MDHIRWVSKDLHTWSRDVLGDLQQRIKKLLIELEDLRRGDLSETNVRKEQVTHFKLGRLEEQLEVFWKQRDHVHWMEKGDKNMIFFFMLMLRRERK